MADVEGFDWVIAGAVAVLVLLAVALLVVRSRARSRERADERAELAELRAEVRELAGRLAAPRAGKVARVDGTDGAAEFVITRIGEDDETRTVSDRVVLSTTLGVPLVKTLALAHGVRRALAPETRNRIGFEVRREVKRTRKVRRREMREAWREMKARRDAGADPAAVDRDVA